MVTNPDPGVAVLYAAGTLSAGPPRPSPAAWPSATPRVGHGEDTSLEDALCWLIWRIERSSQELPGVVQEGEDGESAWGGDEVAVVPFPQPLTEPAVRLSTQRALDGHCRSGSRSRGESQDRDDRWPWRSCSISSLPSWVCWPSPVRVRRGRPAAGSPLRSSRPACCWPSVCPKAAADRWIVSA